jgi:hypothetical protein
MGSGVKAALAKPSVKAKRSKANSGDKNPRALTITFKGIEYSSQKAAMKANNISKYLITRHPEYKVLGTTRSQRK